MKTKLRKLLSDDAWIGALLSLAVFLVYLSTLSSTVQSEDCGELAAAAGTLGIAHPPGYPLFALLGRAWSMLPLGGRVLWKLNLLVASECAIAVGLFYRAFLLMLAERSLFPGIVRGRAAAPASRDSRSGSAHSPDGRDRVAAAVAAASLAFTRTLWSEAVSFEVYALHVLLLSVVLLTFLRAEAGFAERRGALEPWWPLFAYALGLGFANHMMMLLLAPAFLYLHFAASGPGRRAWARIGGAIGPFVLGLTPYLYLPLRAAAGPLMNWGHPSGLRAFWRHVSVEQYRGRMFASVEVLARKAPAFLEAYPREFGYVPLALALFGLWALFRGNRRLFVFSVLLFAGCLFYSLNYDYDDPNFYLNAQAATAIWILYGIRSLLENARRLPAGIAAAACVACVAFPLALNYQDVDESRDFAVEDYAGDMFRSLDSGAVLVSGQEANFATAAFYLQALERVRPDVLVLDYPLMMLPWYYETIERQDPHVLENSRPGVSAYRERYAGYRIGDAAYAARDAIVRDILRYNYGKRPVYVTSDLVPVVRELDGFRGVPAGLALRVARDLPPSVPAPDFRFRPLSKRNENTEKIRTFYAGAYLNAGIFRAMNGDPAGAADLCRKSLAVAPAFAPALQCLAGLPAGAP